MRNYFKLLAAVILLRTLLPVFAYPPAPDHVVYGLVRDELGNPLTTRTAQIILETTAGLKITTYVAPGTDAGVNYKIAIPMDAGITSDLYKPSALHPTVPFKIRIRIGQIDYLPIEMSGDYSKLGQPGEKTRINLTLGEDLDHDGIPDAWARQLMAAIGKSFGDFRAGDDADGDGISNLDEYLAGTYAFDPADGFTLKIVASDSAGAVVEFMAIRGRTYSLLGADDLNQWTPVPFRNLANGESSSVLQNYYAPDVRVVRLRVVPKADQTSLNFFKLMVQ